MSDEKRCERFELRLTPTELAAFKAAAAADGETMSRWVLDALRAALKKTEQT